MFFRLMIQPPPQAAMKLRSEILREHGALRPKRRRSGLRLRLPRAPRKVVIVVIELAPTPTNRRIVCGIR